MDFPLDITFRDMESSPAVEASIRRWAEKLGRAYDRIVRCHVIVERPHQHQRQGQLLRIAVTISVPGPDIVVSRNTGRAGEHEDIQAALRDAFTAARRQLEDHARRMRRDVKTRVRPTHARVTYLDAEGEWGYLEADGRQVYFHRNAVLDGEDLELGDEVRFEEEDGREGPQATTVSAIGAHGHHELPRA
jgi:cold shock CspA family protein/ribosome-associated translation inhibitor RaiA